MNTFIANADGTRHDFTEGAATLKGLSEGLTARACTCDKNTQHIDEIPDWNDHEHIRRERRLRFDTELPVADQLDIIFKQFDALQQAGIDMLPKTKAMIRARKQIEDDLPLSKG